MEMRQLPEDRRRDKEFEAFVAGAGGRLLHAATLLTTEPPAAAPLAEKLLVGALAHTYVGWDRLRGDDPYDHARLELAGRFARSAWRCRRPRGGLLSRLSPAERLVLVLRLYEGLAEEQTAAALGLPVERVRALCARASSAMRSAPPGGAVAGTASPQRERAMP
ncbi:hypothetical protein N566_25360 [Streptomycetaceae bacterium MP113-05]|nr:hypothetical protein N566_25360 [Streptomycetaceae bacterium MP113-05]